MSETTLWKWLTSVLPVGHYSRIESGATSPGFPDVHYQIDDYGAYSGTIELKYARHPKAKIPFKDEDEGLHRSQRIWIRDNLRHGGTVFIIAEVKPLIYVIPGCQASRFNGATKQELEKMSLAILTRDAPEDAYETLKNLLNPEFR